MIDTHLEMATEYMRLGLYDMAAIALRQALAHANKSARHRRSIIMTALNAVRRVK